MSELAVVLSDDKTVRVGVIRAETDDYVRVGIFDKVENGNLIMSVGEFNKKDIIKRIKTNSQMIDGSAIS